MATYETIFVFVYIFIINLDSILKSRDIILPTKVCLVKAMVFPAVMYGCERWTMKKAELRRIDVVELCVGKDSWESLELKEIQPVLRKSVLNIHWKDMLKLKLQYSGHLMWRTDSFEKTLMLGKIDGRRRREWQGIRWRYWLNGHEFEQALGVGDGQGSLTCCSPWGGKESDTEQLNWIIIQLK